MKNNYPTKVKNVSDLNMEAESNLTLSATGNERDHKCTTLTCVCFLYLLQDHHRNLSVQIEVVKLGRLVELIL